MLTLMVEATRYTRVQASVEPLRNDGGTRVSPRRTTAWSGVEVLFRERHRMMASALREESRPGLFVFAAHQVYGHVARMWLEATPRPRAGLIGRHDAVDLALPLDDSISLRHLMFVVRRRGEAVHFAAIDLESRNGLQLESGTPIQLAEASGPLIVCASDFVFFCFPTGKPLPWNCDSADAWATLPPRLASRVEPRGLAPSSAPAVGRLELVSNFRVTGASLSAAALRRGVLIGRAPRCEVCVNVMTVSRVHAVLLSLDDELLIIDAGSTNGIWRLDQEVRIARLRDGDVLALGEEVTLSWRDAH